MTTLTHASTVKDSALKDSALKDPAIKNSAIVWAALVVFTVLSFALGGEELIDHSTLAAAVVIGIGAIKTRIVGLYFMELRAAPAALRLTFEAYCVLLFLVLFGLYALA